MIASLRGTVSAVRDSYCTVEVQGVGYAVNVTEDHRRELNAGTEVFLLTAQIVREDSLTLFGFRNTESLELFEALISVSGVGPRSALAVLSELSPAEAFSAVVSEDDAPFRKVSGIGPKTAKLIVVQLAGKINSLAGAVHVVPTSSAITTSTVGESVISALTGLGWNEKSARDVVDNIVQTTPNVTNSELLKAALASLSGANS